MLPVSLSKVTGSSYHANMSGLKPRLHGTVTTTRHGKGYVGSWVVTGPMITVSHLTLGAKSTQIGGSGDAPEALARIMLGELITGNLPKQH